MYIWQKPLREPEQLSLAAAAAPWPPCFEGVYSYFYMRVSRLHRVCFDYLTWGPVDHTYVMGAWISKERGALV